MAFAISLGVAQGPGEILVVSTEMQAIEVDSIVKTYPGDVRALDGLTFGVPEGTVFGLLGPNGAGKTTAVKVLTTLSRADSGEARVAGLDVVREAAAVRREIGVVQQKHGVDPALTGRENLRLQGRIFGMERRDLEQRVQHLLEQVGLVEAADRVTRGYSGGMQRRLDIAMALVHRPRVLFLDEPTTGLDPEVRVAMWQEIERLRGDEGLTILLTTHYLEEADTLASSIAIVDKGKVVVSGSPEVLKSQLQGDSVSVELAAAAGDAVVVAALTELEDVREVTIEGRSLRARSANGARAVPLVLQALESRGHGVESVTVSRPSLDDVYLRHTGRAFSEADE
jgi:ABC-2 type transport system ATP-binding protein